MGVAGGIRSHAIPNLDCVIIRRVTRWVGILLMALASACRSPELPTPNVARLTDLADLELPSRAALTRTESYLASGELRTSPRITLTTSVPLAGTLHGGSKLWNQRAYDLSSVAYIRVKIAASPEKDGPANLPLNVASSAERAEELLSIYSTAPQRKVGLFTDGKTHVYLIDVRTLHLSRGERTAAQLVFAPMDVSGSFELHEIELLFEPDYSQVGPVREDAVVGDTLQPSFVFGGGTKELAFNLELTPRSILHFSTARREGSTPATLDVDIRANSAWESLFQGPIDTETWADHSIDLARFGDRAVELRFTMKAAGDDGIYYLGSPLVAERSSEAPIVIVYLVDTLRADHLSAYGYSRPTSPNLEAFARHATLFENCYSQATWTKPSITSLFTGLAPDAHRAGEHGQALSPTIPSLGRFFRDAGFVTVSVIANAHAGWSSNLHNGFDRVVDQSLAGPSQADARAVQARLKSAIERHREEPLLLYGHLIDPHLPYADPDGWAERFDDQQTTEEIASYDGEIRYMDEAFGALMKELRASGVADRAIIVFTSDHGENFREGLSVPHGATLEQPETRVPLILFGRNIFPEGKRITTNVQLVDVLPTLLELNGIQAPQMDGRSLLGLVTGERRGHDLAFSHSSDAYQPERTTAVWSGDQKLYARADGTYSLLDLGLGIDDGSQVFRRPRAWNREESQDQRSQFERMKDLVQRYLSRPKVETEATIPELDAKTMEQLRALGYIQ